MSIKKSFMVPWYQLQIIMQLIWGWWTLLGYQFYCNLIISPIVPVIIQWLYNNGLLKCKMLIQKWVSVSKKEYGFIDAPTSCDLHSQIDSNAINILYFCHLGIIMVWSFFIPHIHYICCMIWQHLNLYVNNGGIFDILRTIFDWYTHQEHSCTIHGSIFWL